MSTRIFVNLSTPDLDRAKEFFQNLDWRLQPNFTDENAILERALAAGGTEPRPVQDYGFMHAREFEDPDGNRFGALWMDPRAAADGGIDSLCWPGSGRCLAIALAHAREGNRDQRCTDSR